MKLLLPKLLRRYLSLTICVLLAPISNAQVQRFYIPLLPSAGQTDLGVALVNPTLNEAVITLRARDGSGAIIQNDATTNPATLTLPALGQVALRVGELFGKSVFGQGWIELAPSTPEVDGFSIIFDHDLKLTDGAALVSSPARRLIFPKVTSNPEAANRLSVANTSGNLITRVAISLFDNNGKLAVQKLFSLAAYGAISGNLAEFVGDIGPFDGYAVVEAIVPPTDSPLVGLETYGNGSDTAVLNAVNESARLSTGYIPHFASQGGYESTLVLVNFGADTQRVRISAHSFNTGDSAALPASMTVERSVPRYGRLEEPVGAMFGFSGNDVITGSIDYQAMNADNGLIGYVEFRTDAGTLLSTAQAQGSGYSDWWWSHLAERDGYYTAIGLLNARNEPTLVTIDARNPVGETKASALLSLRPGEHLSRLLRELLPAVADQTGGSVHITATNPVFAFQFLGTESLDMLANAAGQGAMLPHQQSGRQLFAPAGGIVVSEDNVATVTLPASALSADAKVDVRNISGPDLPKPPSGVLAGAVEFHLAGNVFHTPVLLQRPARIVFELDALLPPGSKWPVMAYQADSGAYDQTAFTAMVSPSGRNASVEVNKPGIFAIVTPEGLSDTGIVKITSMTPAHSATGTPVTIQGFGYSKEPGENSVLFEGPAGTNVAAPIVSASETQLVVTTPPGVRTGKVFVQTNSNVSNGQIFSVTDENRMPLVDQITPSKISAGSDKVTIAIAGTGLAPTSVVRYDGVDRAPVFVDSTRLELTLNSSELTPGSHPVTVFNSVAAAASLTTLTSSAAAMASNEMSLTVTNPAPVISDIQPGRGLRGVASDVTIIGSGFASSSTVQVDGTTVSSTFVEASGALIAAIPASSAEFRLITVTNALPGGGLGNSVMFQEDLNQAPVVNAGPNQKITAPGSADLTGSVTDDGLPSGILTTSWIKVSGPGDVTFSNANAPKTAATFSAYGAYVLRLSASDSALVSSADITITVGDINLPQPCVSQISGVVTLVAIATDDERVVGLQFKLDGSNFGPELPTEPYRLAWNTLNTPNGCHTLTAIAWDPEGNIGVSAPLSVTVNNP